MKAWFVMNEGASRCCAAACSSARIRPDLDTACLPVVSICVVGIRQIAFAQ